MEPDISAGVHFVNGAPLVFNKSKRGRICGTVMRTEGVKCLRLVIDVIYTQEEGETPGTRRTRSKIQRIVPARTEFCRVGNVNNNL